MLLWNHHSELLRNKKLIDHVINDLCTFLADVIPESALNPSLMQHPERIIDTKTAPCGETNRCGSFRTRFPFFLSVPHWVTRILCCAVANSQWYFIMVISEMNISQIRKFCTPSLLKDQLQYFD